MANMDEFEKLFCATWKHHSDNNLEEMLTSLNVEEEDKKFGMALKPNITLKRDGDCIIQIWEIAPGALVETKLKFGQEHENKDKDNTPPKWHNKLMPTFDGKAFRQEARSQLPAPKNIDYVNVATVSGDEMTHTMFGLHDDRVKATRVFKRVK